MIVSGFGAVYNTYVFGLTRMEDSWKSVRSPVAQRVSGVAGAFDFFNSDGYPVSPVAVHKRFHLTATSAATLEDAMNTLRAATIVRGSGYASLTKLWFLDRDLSTYLWISAKCTGLNTAESYREKGRWLKRVDLDFYCPEGLWYGDTEIITNVTGTLPPLLQPENEGNHPAFLYVKVELSAGSWTSLAVNNSTNPHECDWTYADAGGFDKVIVNPTTYDVSAELASVPTTNPYKNLTVGSNLPWLWIGPGVNNINFAKVGAGTHSLTYILWKHTYIL